MQVKIQFKPYFKEPMLSGVKVCTSRTKYMGQPGDTFEAFGAQFEILSVEEVRLYEVAALWREEGCKSEEHFKEVWREIHPVVGYGEYNNRYVDSGLSAQKFFQQLPMSQQHLARQMVKEIVEAQP